MTQKITGNMTFHDVMKMSPEVVKVLAKYRLGCVGCMGAMHETLTQGAMAHGIDVDALLKDLNAIFEG